MAPPSPVSADTGSRADIGGSPPAISQPQMSEEEIKQWRARVAQQCGGSAEFKYHDVSEIPFEPNFRPTIDGEGYVALNSSFSFQDPRLAPFNPDHDVAFSLDILGISINGGDPQSIMKAQCDLYRSFGLPQDMQQPMNMVLPEIIKGGDNRYYAIYRHYDQRYCTLEEDYNEPQPGSALGGNGGRTVIPMPTDTQMTFADYNNFVERFDIKPANICVSTYDLFTNPQNPMVSFALSAQGNAWMGGDASTPDNPSTTSTNEATGLYTWDRPSLFNREQTLANLSLGLQASAKTDPFAILPKYDETTRSLTFQARDPRGLRPFDPTRDLVTNIYLTVTTNAQGQPTPKYQFISPEAARQKQQEVTLQDMTRDQGPAETPLAVSVQNNPRGRRDYAAILQSTESRGFDFLARGPATTQTVTNPLTRQSETVTTYQLYAVEYDVSSKDACEFVGKKSGEMLAIDITSISNGGRIKALQFIRKVSDIGPQEMCSGTVPAEIGTTSVSEVDYIQDDEGHPVKVMAYVPLNRPSLWRLRAGVEGQTTAETIQEWLSFSLYDTHEDIYGDHTDEAEKLLPEGVREKIVADIESEAPYPPTFVEEQAGLLVAFGLMSPLLGVIIHRLADKWWPPKPPNGGPGGRGGPGGGGGEPVLEPRPRIHVPTPKDVRDFGQRMVETTQDLWWVPPTAVALEGARRFVLPRVAGWAEGLTFSAASRAPGGWKGKTLAYAGAAAVAVGAFLFGDGDNEAQAATLPEPVPQGVADYSRFLKDINGVYQFVDRPDFSADLVRAADDASLPPFVKDLLLEAIGYYGEDRQSIKAYVPWQLSEMAKQTQ